MAVVKVLVIFQVLLGLFSAMTWAERRLLAFMQFRLGPNRTGPIGILQPVADGIKLFFKEESFPEGANKWLFVLAPVVSIVTAFTAIAVIPYGPPLQIFGREVTLQVAHLDVGILFDQRYESLQSLGRGHRSAHSGLALGFQHATVAGQCRGAVMPAAGLRIPR